MKRKLTLLFVLVLIFSFMLFSVLFPRRLEVSDVEEPVIVDQQEGQLIPEMIEDAFVVLYSDKEIEPESVTILDDIDLSKTGECDITLEFKYRKKSVQKTVTLMVVDRREPEIIIKDDEYVFLKGEEIELTPDNLLINAYDGINGLINDRIDFLGEVDFDKVGKYNVTVSVSDKSGNISEEDIVIRITDNIDEYAKILYDKSIKFFHGDYFVYTNFDKHNEIINFEQSLSLLTQAQLDHFKWLSGLHGNYNEVESGIKLSLGDDDQLYGDTSLHKHLNNYQETKLELKEESENYREYIAISYYKDGEGKTDKNGYKRKFVIVKENDRWKVNEFYLPY